MSGDLHFLSVSMTPPALLAAFNWASVLATVGPRFLDPMTVFESQSVTDLHAVLVGQYCSRMRGERVAMEGGGGDEVKRRERRTRPLLFVCRWW
jgi:hypothetical protein